MARKTKKVSTPADCHPNRPNYSSGLCGTCYFRERRADANGGNEAVNALEVRMRNELIELHKDATEIANIKKHAQMILTKNMPRFAELQITAAEIAALDGDDGPAFRALTSLKVAGSPVVDPPKKDSGGSGGVKVFIGVKLGGVPSAAEIQAEVVDEESE